MSFHPVSQDNKESYVKQIYKQYSETECIVHTRLFQLKHTWGNDGSDS